MWRLCRLKTPMVNQSDLSRKGSTKMHCRCSGSSTQTLPQVHQQESVSGNSLLPARLLRIWLRVFNTSFAGPTASRDQSLSEAVVLGYFLYRRFWNGRLKRCTGIIKKIQDAQAVENAQDRESARGGKNPQDRQKSSISDIRDIEDIPDIPDISTLASPRRSTRKS